MEKKTIAPFGSWRSPIRASMVAAGAKRLDQIVCAGGEVYWTESRPLQAGRIAIVRRQDDEAIVDVLPEEYSARTRIHEYGGSAYCVHASTLFFSNDSDQRLYRLDPDNDPQPITPDPIVARGLRYGDGRVTPDGRFIVCVRETHHDDGHVINELVAVASDGSDVKVIDSGRDFYSFPRINANGSCLAWTCWDHPQMPWDGTELWVADWSDHGSISNARRVAGGSAESIFQPEWGRDNALYFVSDRSGWWNLYCERDGSIAALAPMQAEFGVPQWLLGASRYALLPDGRVACLYQHDGVDHLGLIPAHGGALKRIDLPYTSMDAICADDASRVWFVGASWTESDAVRVWSALDGSLETVSARVGTRFDPAYISRPRAIEFPVEGGLTAHAFYYPPAHPGFDGPLHQRPPLLVVCHGGPTSAAKSKFDLAMQFWTSRGFAIVDVNYGGSSGFGRAYRERLRGQWGVVDVADCIAAATQLADEGVVDGERLIIRGGSAGGYTTLCALSFTNVFAAGASHYGISDLETFVLNTHKFEAHYVDSLIGPFLEAQVLYQARSPIHYTQRVTCPMILFQGLEDKVVPPAQAETMVRALQPRGVPHAYVTFANEAHGFRVGTNIERALEAELYFYSRIFDFKLAEKIEPVKIENF